MSAKTIAAYAQHRADAGLPPTLPPPPAPADLRAVARREMAIAGHVLAMANESDPIKARVLRRIGASIVNTAQSLFDAASNWEENPR